MATHIEPGPVAQDTQVDVVVVGSGTGLAAALAAHDAGLRVLVIEKTEFVGGSTARSGGLFWIPLTDALERTGKKDSKEKVEEYLRNLVGDTSPEARWKSFVTYGNDAVSMLERTTPMRINWVRGYSDYHPETPGGDGKGRSAECAPFDLNQLGEDKSRFRGTVVKSSLPMPITSADYKALNLIKKKPISGMAKATVRLAQGVGGKLIRKDMVAGGQATAGGMFAGVIQAGIPVWTRAAFTDLIVEDGRVTGITVVQDDKTVTVTADKAVILAAGGYAHNLAWRHQYHSPSLKPNTSFASPGNTGEAISIPQEQADANLSRIDECWWFPAVAPLSQDVLPLMMLAERSLPGSYIINQDGKRFINEAIEYMTFGQTILQMEREGNPVSKMWIIFDQEYRDSYVFATQLMPGQAIPESWYEAGIAHKANSPYELAEKLGVPTEAFNQTHGQFNTMAANGKDTDFARGESVYDQYYGDPKVKPNPNLRPVNQGMLYAVEVILTDLGTCGGLQADERSRVLREDGSIIPGLYAIGNNATNVFGNTYPGAGATIGQGIVSGYIAAMDAAGKL